MIFTSRIIRAARLDAGLYREVKSDAGATAQAVGIVVLSSLAAGIGGIRISGFSGILLGTIGALAGWYVWAFLAFLIGAKILAEPETKTNLRELLRTIGFAGSPGLIRIFGVVPGVTTGAFFIGSIWMLAAMVIAVKEALNYRSTVRAAAVCLIGWLIQIGVVWLITLNFR